MAGSSAVAFCGAEEELEDRDAWLCGKATGTPFALLFGGPKVADTPGFAGVGIVFVEVGGFGLVVGIEFVRHVRSPIYLLWENVHAVRQARVSRVLKVG
jgi:hypothetical protein